MMKLHRESEAGGETLMIEGAIVLTAPKMPSPAEAVMYMKAQSYDSIPA